MRLFKVLFGIGIAIIVGGAIYASWFLPRWSFAICIVAMLLFAFLPSLIGTIVDPANSRAIRAYVEKLGVSSIVVRLYPSHYGVHFRANGKKHYAKCLVIKRGQFKWKGKSPEEILRENQEA